MNCVEKLKKLSLDNKISLVQLAIDAISRILKVELPHGIFVIVTMAGFFWGIKELVYIVTRMGKNWKEYTREKNKLRKKAEKCTEIQKRYAYIADQLKIDWKNETKKNVKKSVIKQALLIPSIIVLCYTNPKNMEAFCDSVKSVLSAESRKEMPENTQTEMAINDIAEQNTAPQTEENAHIGNDAGDRNIIRKPKEYRFILDNRDEEPQLDSKIEKQVFHFEADENLNQVVSRGMLAILGERKEAADISTKRDANGWCVSDYMSMEEKFKNKADTYVCEEDYNVWLNNAPHSGEMELYLHGREQLAKEFLRVGNGHYELWWRLANDYQYYAQEYEAQTGNGTAVLYYYSMSIYCCMKALEYKMPLETRNMIWNYMNFRYQDIGRDDSVVDNAHKVRAQQVQDAISALQM